jgi:hypothetical protein
MTTTTVQSTTEIPVCHLGTRAASNSATTRVPIAMTNQTVALEVDDDGLATLDIDPSSARSLARALVRAADLAEGVTA